MNMPNAEAEKDPIVGLDFAGCQIVKKLGAGAMGTVYLGHHPGLDKYMCVKILAPALAKDERNVQFFLREARSAARLDHKNIVSVFNAGIEHGYHFLSMSFIDGVTLQAIIKEKGKLSVDESIKIITGILEGMKAAHEQGIIHRDIKPTNILVTKDGVPKIVDFGLARKVDEDQQLTMVGEMVGTAYYMSPEQGLGKKVDHRADLYSIGATLFYMLSGKYPYEGKTSVEVIHKHISEEPPSLFRIAPEIPMWLSDIIMRLMQKKPDDRFQSADEVIRTLQARDKKAGAAQPAEPVKAGSAVIDFDSMPASSALKVSGAQANPAPAAPETPALAPVYGPVPPGLSGRVSSLSPSSGSGTGMQEFSLHTPVSPVLEYTPAIPEAQLSRRAPRPEVKVFRKFMWPDFRTAAGNVSDMLLAAALIPLSALCMFVTGLVSGERLAAGARLSDVFVAPWVTPVPSVQTALLSTALFVVVCTLIAVRRNKVTFRDLALACAVVLAYVAGAVSQGATITHRAMNSILALQPEAVSNMVVYASGAYLLAGYFLSGGRQFVSKLAGVLLGGVMLYCVFVFSAAPVTSSASFEPGYIIGSVAAALCAFVLAFMRRTFVASMGPWLMLLAAAALLWLYQTSPRADYFVQDVKREQSEQIEKVLKAKAAMTARDPKRAEKIKVPRRSTSGELSAASRKMAFLYPLKRFADDAGKVGSYFLMTLMFVLIAVLLAFGEILYRGKVWHEKESNF